MLDHGPTLDQAQNTPTRRDMVEKPSAETAISQDGTSFDI